jgi:hypothetical protein
VRDGAAIYNESGENAASRSDDFSIEDVVAGGGLLKTSERRQMGTLGLRRGSIEN